MNAVTTNLTSWITEKFISASSAAACKAVESLATHEALLLLKPLKAETIITCLNPMDSLKAAAILRRLPARQTSHILSRMELSQAARIFQAFSLPQQEKLKALLPPSFQKAMQQSIAWPENSAGARMSRHFVAFKTEQKVADVIEKLKTCPRKKLPVACVIVAKDNHVKGYIRTAELAFVPEQSVLGSVMTDVHTLEASAQAAQASQYLQEGQPFVPVVDKEGELLGILLLEDLVLPPVKKKRFGWF